MTINAPESFWKLDWSSREKARQHMALVLHCNPSELHVEGPDGGPYIISFAPDTEEELCGNG